jgi:hypothetical protein
MHTHVMGWQARLPTNTRTGASNGRVTESTTPHLCTIENEYVQLVSAGVPIIQQD